VSSRILLIVVRSDEERAAFNESLRTTVHRSIFALGLVDGLTRFVEVRPDMVLLPFSGDKAMEEISTVTKRMRIEPCGTNIPIVLYDSTVAKLKDPRKILKKLGASAFLPWPPRQAQLGRAIQVLTTEHSTDGAVPPQPEESTAEITIDRSDALEIDPILARAAIALDEETDEIPTNPRQSLSEQSNPENIVSVPSPSGDQEETPAQALLSSPPRTANSIPADNGTLEAVPVFRVPTGFEQTPVKPVQVHDLESPKRDKSISDSSMSVPEFMIEPELPSRETGQSTLTDTAKKRIEELPRGGGDDSGSFSEPRLPIESISKDRKGAGRKGLDESRLGKRLVRRINKTHEALQDLNYYELLGVDGDSDPKALREAYFALSLEFHPDRFFLLTSGALKEKIYAVFRRINEAYLVLNDGRRRASYDEGLQKPVPLMRAVTNERGFSPLTNAPANRNHVLKVKAFTPQGEDFVRRAQLAFGDEDYDGARMYLTLALSCEPGSTEINDGIKQVLKQRPSLNAIRRW